MSTTVPTQNDLAMLKQNTKFLSESNAKLKAELRKAEKAAAAQVKLFAQQVDENQLLTMAFANLERYLAEPNWDIFQKMDAIRDTVSRTRGELIKS